MATHDRLDGFSSFLSVIEWNGGYVVVQDVRFDYAVEQRTADESELAVDGGCSSAGKGPRLGSVMRNRGIGVLQVGDCDLVMQSVNVSMWWSYQSHVWPGNAPYLASDLPTNMV